MADSEQVVVYYFAISNIPASFRSATLRNYFSQFIESGGFHCFHYRHRPEILREAEEGEPKDRPEVLREAEEGEPKDRPEILREAEEGEPKDRPEVLREAEEDARRTDEDPKESPLEGENSGASMSAETKPTAAVKAVKTCCCIVAVHSQHADRLLRLYAGNQWIDPKGNWLSRRCVIKRIKVSQQTDEHLFPYKTKLQQRRRVSLTECFTEADLKALPELNPPSLMENGNVGTTIKVFLQLIQSCRLPPRLIRKLGLTFPKTSCNRRYGNVPFQYYDSFTMPQTEDNVFTAAGHEIAGPGGVTPKRLGPRKPCDVGQGATEAEEEEEEVLDEEDGQSNADDDDDRCEEWERHEALYEDVTSQERCKERLFEEKIELKWEKGGSGLVFYTDAQYWAEEEGDFDEQTADDWDVDMSVYYDKDGGDMDSRDYVRMRYEKRLRDGLEDRSGRGHPIGSFEKFTKGFGRRVMEKQGWKDGEGLGNSQVGIPAALENDGQHPKCKRGFGYHGEKLNLYPVKRARKEFHISTVYDKPKDVDQGDSVLRRQQNTNLKFRGWQPGGSIGPRR